MAEKKGRITATSPDGWAEVLVERSDACSNCESAQFCHALSDCSKIKTKVINTADARAGDLVVIRLNTGVVLRGAFILYIVPIVVMLLGAVSGYDFSGGLGMNPTFAAMIFAFAGLALGFLIPAFFSRTLSARQKLTPVVTRILKRNSADLTFDKHFNTREALSGK